jgi:hypothetical protein
MSTHAGPDLINHPPHYTSHPSGIECIQVTEHMNFNVGNAIKYLWRASEKGRHLEDLRKARWYIDREIKRVEGPPIKPLSMTRAEERWDVLKEDHQQERLGAVKGDSHPGPWCLCAMASTQCAYYTEGIRPEGTRCRARFQACDPKVDCPF